MKKLMVIFSLALVLVCFSTYTVLADQIYGGISFSGAAEPDNQDLTVATSFISYAKAVVANTDGDYEAIDNGAAVTFKPFSFKGLLLHLPIAPLWTIAFDGKTYSFDATSLSVFAVREGDIVLIGSGIANITGYDATPGEWSFTANTSRETYSFSASTTVNPVPEPATMLLLGLGLTGVAGLRRKFSRA